MSRDERKERRFWEVYEQANVQDDESARLRLQFEDSLRRQAQRASLESNTPYLDGGE